MGGHDEEEGGSRTRFFFPWMNSAGCAEIAQERLGRVCFCFTVFGGVFLLVGALCILLPIIFSGLSIQQLVSWILITGGVAALLQFLLVLGAPGTTSFLLLGILHLGFGIGMLFRSNAFVSLLDGWLSLHGAFKVIMAYEVRMLKARQAISWSGVISIILNLIISLAGVDGFRLLCILFGIDLAITGIAFLLVSIMEYATSRNATQNPLLGDA